MFKELKEIESDLESLNRRAKRLVKDIERLAKDIQKVIDEEKADALGYAVTDYERIIAVGEWPYGRYDEEVQIKLKSGVVKYQEVSSEEVYIGEVFVKIKDIKVNKAYFEDAIRILCALAHERYTKRAYSNWFFTYYVPEKKDAPVFVVYDYRVFVAIAPVLDEIIVKEDEK